MATSTYSNEDVGLVLGASDPASLFGDNPNRARIRYHRLAVSVHPDANGNSEESVRAMARLNALWAEYSKPEDRRGKKAVVEVTRSESYVVLDEGATWTVVRRRSCAEPSGTCPLDRLARKLDGTPVTMLRLKSTKYIPQRGDLHGAFECTVPDTVSGGRKAIMLQSLEDRLPNGKLHPADLAWITKRILFLSGALCACELKLEPAMGSLAIAPDSHMLVMMAPWELEEHDGGMSRGMVAEFWDLVKTLLGDDQKSRRIERFLLGVNMDSMTPWRNLMYEFDDLLYELFGRPRFHEMETSHLPHG